MYCNATSTQFHLRNFLGALVRALLLSFSIAYIDRRANTKGERTLTHLQNSLGDTEYR